MIIDIHGQYMSAHDMMNYPYWKKDFALRNDIVMLWPDGLNDSPDDYRAWNCSKTVGPRGKLSSVSI